MYAAAHTRVHSRGVMPPEDESVRVWLAKHIGGDGDLDDVTRFNSKVVRRALWHGFVRSAVLPRALLCYLEPPVARALVHVWSLRFSDVHDATVKRDARSLLHRRALSLFGLDAGAAAFGDEEAECFEGAVVCTALACTTSTPYARHHELAADLLEIAAIRVTMDGCTRAREMLARTVSHFCKDPRVAPSARRRLCIRYVSSAGETLTRAELSRLSPGTLVETYNVVVHCGMQAVSDAYTGYASLYCRLLFMYSDVAWRFVDALCGRLAAMRAAREAPHAEAGGRGGEDGDGGEDDERATAGMIIVIVRVMAELLKRLPWPFALPLLRQPRLLDVLVDSATLPRPPPGSHLYLSVSREGLPTDTAHEVALLLRDLHHAAETGRQAGPPRPTPLALRRSLKALRASAGAASDPRVNQVFDDSSVRMLPWAVVHASLVPPGNELAEASPAFWAPPRRRRAADALRARVDPQVVGTLRLLGKMTEAASDMLLKKGFAAPGSRGGQPAGPGAAPGRVGAADFTLNEANATFPLGPMRRDWSVTGPPRARRTCRV